MIKPRVINYKDIYQLFEAIQEGRLVLDGPVITASSKMLQAWKDVFEKDARIKAHHINHLLPSMLPEWYSDASKLEQLLIIRRIIDDYGKNEAEDKKRILSFRQNSMDILSSIRDLFIIGIRPDDILFEDVDLKLFKKIYLDFEKEMSAWLSDIAGCMTQPGLIERFQKAKIAIQKSRKIYFQGFYYITPIQYRLISALSSANMEVIFLNNYDEDIKYAYQVWEENKHFKGLQKEQLKGTARAKRFAAVFNGKETESCVEDIELEEFQDVFSYVRSVDDYLEQGVVLFSPTGDDVEEVVDTFFPEKNVKDHLLAYPVGQYLLGLYKAWDAQQEQLIFTNDMIRNCIATGWAGRDIADSRSVLDLFEKVKVYFEDCRTEEEWSERLQTLRFAVRNIVKLFEPKEKEYDNQAVRWTEVLGNPLKYVGAFSCSEAEIDKIEAVIISIFADAKTIFPEGKQIISIGKHFEKMLGLIYAKADKKNLQAEEKKIVKEVQERLKHHPRYITECAADSLADAMTFFLGGSLKEKGKRDEIEEETSKDSDSIMFGAIADIEALPFIKKAKNKKLFLGFCDSVHMPGSATRYPWPLSQEVMSNIGTHGNKMVSRLKDCYIDYIESTRVSNRYLFFLALQNPGINISWISGSENKPVGPSPYLNLLEMYGAKINRSGKRNLIDIKKKKDTIKYEMPDVKELHIAELGEGDCPPEVSYNDKLCELRNLYDYILEKYPVFTNHFHLQFYFTNLILAIYKMIQDSERNVSIEEIGEQVFKLYPGFDAAQRREKVDFASFMRGHDDIFNTLEANDQAFRGKKYPYLRYLLKYLNDSVNPVLYDEATRQGDKDERICIFCPHGQYCRKHLLHE